MTGFPPYLQKLLCVPNLEFLQDKQNIESLEFCHIFRGLENPWNLLKKWEKNGILTQNLEKSLY